MQRIIVITGSTRGIGYGLADAFLARDCAVMVSGRTTLNVEAAVQHLRSAHPGAAVDGIACDVTQYNQVDALWKTAEARFGRVDIWINNAGVAHNQMKPWELEPDALQAVIKTNVVGSMYGCRVAMQSMLAQGGGAIYNLEGLGADGRKVTGLAFYGSTKAAIHYFTQALAAEAKGTPVIIGALAPGMVATDMITMQYQNQPEAWERDRRIFNIIGDTLENVAPWLVERMLQNRQNGVRLAYTSGGKMMWRFLSSPFIKRKVFE